MDQLKQMSVFEMFAASQETFEEAKKKSNDESGKRINYFRLSQDGTYAVRILPLAPVIDADGNILPMERKGYEYPLRSLMLKINTGQKDKSGKEKVSYVTVCNAKYAFPQLESDLIDKYVSVACDLYADDTKLCEKLRSTSFNGGLKWDARRCMYIIDVEKPGDGIQILQLSFSQYKELEERKLNLWNKLNKGGKNVPCPISSIDSAYPLEIVRKTEAKKTTYAFNIDTISGVQPLNEEELQSLLDTQRLPEVLYRYTRYHLEATIAYLTQLDAQYDISVINDESVKETIEQIKLLLPADDQSHFNLESAGAEQPDADDSIDALWDRFDKLEDEGLDDKSAEGQELRTSIKEFIENNELNIKISRSKSNQDLLEEIEKALASEGADEEEEEEEEEEKPAKHQSRRQAPAPEPEEDDDPEPEATEDNEDEPKENARGTERNEDTNEPAARPSRRSARPARRR